MQARSIADSAARLDTDVVAGPWPVDAPTYHADKLCLSHGQLEDFRESVPLYHGRHVLGTIPRRKPSDAMSLGTALHFAVLQPDLFATEVVTAPSDINRRTNAGKAEWAAFELSSAGKTIIDADDYATCLAMADAIRGHSKARAALESDGPTEYAIRWRDGGNGVWVRNLIDKLYPAKELLINLKTAADPSPAGFAKAVANFGYHRSSAMYVQGAREALGYADPQELFVVVGKDAPHEVACYVLDDAALQLGARQNAADMLDLAQRRASGDWSSRHAGLIETVALAPWALKAE